MITYPEYLHQIYDYCISYRNGALTKRHPLSSQESYKPFFIIGSGRSGSTLLRRMLNNHSSIGIPPETYVLGPVIKRYRQHRGMKWEALVEFVLSAFECHPEFETFNISLQPLVKELKSCAENNRNLAYIINRFYLFSCAELGYRCERWADKSPINTFYLDRIFSVFPDAQFIHILRDGCDVVSSYVESGIYSSCEEAAKRWSVSVDLVEKFYRRNPQVGITINYENLVSDPESTLIDVCRFLDVEYEQGMAQEGHEAGHLPMGDVEKRRHHSNVLGPVTTSSIGKGRIALSHDEKLSVDRIIGNQLKRLGYHTCTS